MNSASETQIASGTKNLPKHVKIEFNQITADTEEWRDWGRRESPILPPEQVSDMPEAPRYLSLQHGQLTICHKQYLKTITNKASSRAIRGTVT